jgi:hypothetical protein
MRNSRNLHELHAEKDVIWINEKLIKAAEHFGAYE